MKIFEGQAFVAKTKLVRFDNDVPLQSEPDVVNIDWEVKAEDGKALICFGHPIEYYVDMFLFLTDNKDSIMCLRTSSKIGEESVYLFKRERKRLERLLRENIMNIAMCAGLSAESEKDKIERKFIASVRR